MRGADEEDFPGEEEPAKPPQGIFTSVKQAARERPRSFMNARAHQPVVSKPVVDLPEPKFRVDERVEIDQEQDNKDTPFGFIRRMKFIQSEKSFFYDIQMDDGLWVTLSEGCVLESDEPVPSPRKTTFNTGAQRGEELIASALALIPLEALEAWGEAFAEGEKKYGRDNWLKGIPFANLCEHAIRHIYRFLAGDTSENHIGHAIWNIGALIYFIKHRPDLDDRPKYAEHLPERE